MTLQPRTIAAWRNHPSPMGGAADVAQTNHEVLLHTDQLTLQLLLEVLEVLAEVLIGFAQVVDRTAGVEHRSVVLATAVQTDVGQRTLGHLLGEVHRNLTRLNDLALARLGLEQLDGQVEVIAHHLLDVVDADFAGRVLDKLVDHLLGQIERDGLAVQAALRDQADERPSNSRMFVLME